jgi:ribosomal protein L40E
MLETWPQLYVDDVDEVRALRVLREAAAPALGSVWVCEGCGERSEPQFTSCWRCGTERNPGVAPEPR